MSHVSHPPRFTAHSGRKATNGLGIAGFVVSVASVLTCGLTSPIGLLLSLVALRKRPRGFAAAGAILGGLGTALITGAILLTITAGRTIHTEIETGFQTRQTMQNMSAARDAIEAYRAEHGKLPEGIEGNKLVVITDDAWGEALRYDQLDDHRYQIRSAGPDRQFETADDVTQGASSELHEPPQTAPRDLVD